MDGWRNQRALLQRVFTGSEVCIRGSAGAQQVYKFERPNLDKTSIESNDWDASRDGLLSGERLYLALRRLEVAYASGRGHGFKISKTVSLRKLKPNGADHSS